MAPRLRAVRIERSSSSIAIAVVKAKLAPTWVGGLIGVGAVAAFQLPAGPDALGWLAVAAGTALVVRTARPFGTG